jgi:hypothetical protein
MWVDGSLISVCYRISSKNFEIIYFHRALTSISLINTNLFQKYQSTDSKCSFLSYPALLFGSYELRFFYCSMKLSYDFSKMESFETYKKTISTFFIRSPKSAIFATQHQNENYFFSTPLQYILFRNDNF